jgi:hypothetical protein
LVTTGTNGTPRIWDLRTGKSLCLGKKQSFTIHIEGDELRQSGQLSDGTKIEEKWQQVK